MIYNLEVEVFIMYKFNCKIISNFTSLHRGKSRPIVLNENNGINENENVVSLFSSAKLSPLQASLFGMSRNAT